MCGNTKIKYLLWTMSDYKLNKYSFSATGTNLIVIIDSAEKAPYIPGIVQDAETKARTYSEFNSVDVPQMQYNRKIILKNEPFKEKKCCRFEKTYYFCPRIYNKIF
jgi:hypothetical protein